MQGTIGDGQAVGDLLFRDDPAIRGGFDPENANYIGTEVTADGQLLMLFDNGTSYLGGQIRLKEFVAPQELTKLGQNLYGNLQGASPTNEDGSAVLEQATRGSYALGPWKAPMLTSLANFLI